MYGIQPEIVEIITQKKATIFFTSIFLGALSRYIREMVQLHNPSRVCSVRYVPRRTGGIYRRYYRYRTPRYVRYGVNTGTGNFGKFGTTSIPVPETSVSSVRHRYRYRRCRYRLSYRYRTLRQVRYDVNTGTRHFGEFGTLSIPVPETSVSSVRHQYRYRILR